MTTNTPARKKVSELKETEYFKKQNDVVDDFLRGITEPTALAKAHGITRADAIVMLDEWRDFVRSDKSFKEMGRERLHEMDRHYALLIKDGHETIQELKDGGSWDKVGAALKVVADIEHKRQDALQKAGMYDDGELADMLIENERKTEEISKFLLELVEDEPHLKNRIIDALKKIEDPNYIAPMDIEPGQKWTTVDGGDLIDG